MKDEKYEKHKKRCREYAQTGLGKIKVIARQKALKYLVEKHRKEFVTMVRKFEKERLGNE